MGKQGLKIDHLKSVQLKSLLLSLTFVMLIPLVAVNAKSEVEPLVWHEYDYFDLNLSKGHCKSYSREPWAVKVKITYLYPSDGKVSVTITVNGELKWGKLMSMGESSPTINCYDQYTVVHIAHPNGGYPPIHVKGYIDWVMH